MQTTHIRWLIPATLAALLFAATSAWAVTDYSSMTNAELAARRGTMRNASPEERNAFHQEWQKRLQQMSPEERQQAMSPPANAPRNGRGRGLGRGMGQGSAY